MEHKDVPYIVYASTESPEERDILNKLQNKLNNTYK